MNTAQYKERAAVAESRTRLRGWRWGGGGAKVFDSNILTQVMCASHSQSSFRTHNSHALTSHPPLTSHHHPCIYQPPPLTPPPPPPPPLSPPHALIHSPWAAPVSCRTPRSAASGRGAPPHGPAQRATAFWATGVVGGGWGWQRTVTSHLLCHLHDCLYLQMPHDGYLPCLHHCPSLPIPHAQ